MSGGRIALSGFDYQTVVILDQLFNHFDAELDDARARPEGSDDLDLLWKESGRECRHHVQVKKPRETDAGDLKREPWRLSEIADELLPNTFRLLRDGDATQTWILGDELHTEGLRLIEAGLDAPSKQPTLYWAVVHLMARASILAKLPKDRRGALLRWRFKNPGRVPAEARIQLTGAYSSMLEQAGSDPNTVDLYQDQVCSFDASLPSVLARVRILADYGTEAEVAKRFQDRLQREYGLPLQVVSDSLFGNFRSFINDIAKQPGKTIDRSSFEIELRSAWPQMSSATEPPTPPPTAVVRRDLIEPLVSPGGAKVVEVIGISGSGKSTLAAQAAAALSEREPMYLPIYARVRANASFRDVISGIAFYLLRRGTPDIFGLAVESKPADDTIIDRLAELCRGLPRPVLLLLDLVEGYSSIQFGRDLGQFARALAPGSCRLVVFSQESTFATLNGVETGAAGIETINMRGFHLNEFASLVDHFHPSADRRDVHEVFNRITVGRPAGISAQLAEALARQPSLESMKAVAKGPANDFVSAAERRRFDQLPSAIRPAAEHLVCFALRFRRKDAEAAFPDQNVGGAIDALISLGLLRRDIEGLLEMHEQVRAGLESAIAINTRQGAHILLAAWYERKGDIASQIFHLDKAGCPDEADTLAKQAFLRGEAWRSLEGYVKRRMLVTAQDLIDVAARHGRIADFYLFRFLVPELASDTTEQALFDLLSHQRSRYFEDHDWARTIVEALLVLNPTRFQDLLVFTVNHAAGPTELEQGLAWLQIAARGDRYSPSNELVAFASSQTANVQRNLLPILLQDGRQSALALAFKILAAPAPYDERRSSAPHSVDLKIETREDVVEILAALPTPSTAMMIAKKTMGFGAVGSLLWRSRQKLCRYCTDILSNEIYPVAIRSNAWRVLLFVGDTNPETLLDPLLPKAGLEDCSLLGPAFAPAAYSADRYTGALLDPSAPLAVRHAALGVLLFLDADFEALRSQLSSLANDPLSGLWDQYFLLLFAKRPFVAGVRLLRSNLEKPPREQLPPAFIASSLDAAAETDWPEVTDLLVDCLSHNDRGVRLSAVLGLGRRRSAKALEVLRRRVTIETDPSVSAQLASALTACGAKRSGELSSSNLSSVHVLWQCILAMRTGDESFSSELVHLATSPSVHWAIRRTAIWASARLPSSGSFLTIAPTVLAESSPLTIDDDEHFYCHLHLGDMLENGIADLLGSGETAFLELVQSILEAWWGDLLWRDNLPTPAEAVRWLHSALIADPTPAGIERLRNSLRVPLLHAAVLRGYRIRNMSEQIEAILANASTVWLAVRCLMERRKIGHDDPDLAPRLRKVLPTSVLGDVPLLGRIVDEIEASTGKPVGTPKPPSIDTPAAPVARILSYAEVIGALLGKKDLDLDQDQPLALEPTDATEMQRLISLADPSNDPRSGVTKFTPALTFTSKGHLVNQETWTSTGAVTLPERLRPAIAAANRFDLPILWHDERMRTSWNTAYVTQLLGSLGAQADDKRFYQVVEAHADIIVPMLGKYGGERAVMNFLDDRLIPVLKRCAHLGGHDFFEALCNLSRYSVSRATLPLLSTLLSRFVSSLDENQPGEPNDGVGLWRGLARIKDHPLFCEIPGWRKTLEKSIRANVNWIHKQNIFRILEVDAGSYIAVENQLVREEDWAHFYQSEIDLLDAAAERLFPQLRP